MESKSIEWKCPTCAPRKIDELKLSKSSRKRPRNPESKSKSSSRRSSTSSLNSSKSNMSTSATEMSTDTPSKITHCVVCKKEARKNTVYCSDKCILAHADKTTVKDKPVSPSLNKPPNKLQMKPNTPASGKHPTPGTIKMSISGKSKTVTQIKISGQIKTPSPQQAKSISKADLEKARAETHVVVYDKKTGEVLRGKFY